MLFGHIHKKENKTSNIVYPGSLVSLGFDEPGEHGMIVGEITPKEVKTEFISIDDTYFETKNIDISMFSSQEDLIENLNEIYKENTYFKIVLTGTRNFEINTNKILNLISNENILKLYDNTQSSFDLNALKNQPSLKGIFVKNMLLKLENEPENSDIIKNAIEIGLRTLE